MYREQEYVEKCHCGAAVVGPCGSCGRARCERHLERGLCNRCVQFIGAEVQKRSGRPWVAGGVVGSGFALAMLVCGLPGVTVVGLPVGIATFFAHRVWQRRRLTRLMGPALAASRGELPPPKREERFPDAPTNNYGGYGGS
jgi:hypothetical protein